MFKTTPRHLRSMRLRVRRHFRGRSAPLMHDARPDPGKLAGCRSAIEEALKLKIQQVESLVAGGHHDDAQKLLTKIDEHFGGLAAPRSVDLAQ